MANEEHLAILSQGVEVWNQWRLDHPKIEPDLNEAQLNDRNLTGVNFSETMLIWANLSRANLSRSKLTGSDFMGANLSRVNLTRTNLRSTNLVGASLTGANLSNNYLGELDFSNVLDLSEVDFSGANLWRMKAFRVNLNRAILTGACIEEWQISGASLDDVVCEYIYLQQDEMEPFEYSDRRPSNPKEPFASGEFSRLCQEEQGRGTRHYTNTSIRFEKGKLDENLTKLVKLIDTAAIEAIFDPYLDNAALDSLVALQALGVSISSEIRVLTSDKVIKPNKKGMSRLTKAHKEKTFQALSTVGEIRWIEEEHRRFMLLSGGVSLIIGMSLNELSKNEAALIESDRDDRAFFDSQWSSAQVFN